MAGLIKTIMITSFFLLNIMPVFSQAEYWEVYDSSNNKISSNYYNHPTKNKYLRLYLHNYKAIPKEAYDFEEVSMISFSGTEINQIDFSLFPFCKEVIFNNVKSVPKAHKSGAVSLAQFANCSKNITIRQIAGLRAIKCHNNLPDKINLISDSLTHIMLYDISQDYFSLLTKFKETITNMCIVASSDKNIANIKNFKNIEYLELETLNIQSIPVEIIELKKLKKIILSDLKIDTIPNNMFSMPSLKEISISDCLNINISTKNYLIELGESKGVKVSFE